MRAGDTILVHAGLYTYSRYEYTNNASVNRTVPLDGTYYLTADGTPDMPTAIKAAGDGEVIFDGAGNFNLFNVKGADYTYFEGITFRNTEIAFWAGTQFITGSKGLTVRRCRFEDVGVGVLRRGQALRTGSRRRLQLHHRFPRWDQCGDIREPERVGVVGSGDPRRPQVSTA